MGISDIDHELRELILSALNLQYVSESCKDGLKTGNHYQSVALKDLRTAGFRTDRGDFLDRIQFAGMTVLDLGSNLGEMSRAARSRGACLVDGFEYDPYFVQLAGMINAYNGTTRVSFFVRDITDPSIYREQYDIVLAFSVFTYIRTVLDSIAGITGQLFVVETHKLSGALESGYLKHVLPYFPHYRILGESDWSTRHNGRETRAVIAFAKQESALAAALKSPPVEVSTRAEEYRCAAPPPTPASDAPPRHIDIDVLRTRLQERFFSKFRFDSADQLLARVADMPVELHDLVQSDDLTQYGVQGWAYWLLFLKGYLQHRETGRIGEGNVYYDYLTKHFVQQPADPGLSKRLGVPAKAVERVQRRFGDLDFFRDMAARGSAGLNGVAPLRVVISDPPPKHPLAIYQIGSGTPLLARLLDGWHRLFAAKLHGVDRLRGEVIYEDPRPGHIRGCVEDFKFDGRRLFIRGWCVHPSRAIESIEVRVEETTVTRVGITPRPDVKERYGSIPHAKGSGFVVDCECTLPADEPVLFKVLPLSSWLPAGAMAVYYLPGMFGERKWPPAHLTQRSLNETEPAKLAFRSAKCLYEMLEPLRRHRALDSFASVLDWGVGCGLLQFFLPNFLPMARVLGVDADEETVHWFGQSGLPGEFMAIAATPPTDLPSETFDLVLGYSTLTRFTREAQLAWLGELHRVIRPGGYLVVTVNGELIRPFLTVPEVLESLDAYGLAACATSEVYQTRAYAFETYSKWFDIVKYVDGGVDDLRDLIILRKAGDS